MTRALLALLLSGCSFMFTTAPEPNKPCNTSEVSPISDAAIAVVLGLGTLGAIVETTEPYGDDDAKAAAITVGLFTALFTASAIKGFDNIGQCRRHQKRLYEESLTAQAAEPMPVSTRIDAWQMTKQAKAAARAGDCDTVAALEQVVRNLDSEFYRTVFARDHAIIQCTATREIPIAPPSATPPTAVPPATP
jgi:hypothetical protein